MDHALFQRSANATLEVRYVGREQEPLVIVDSYMTGAEQLRALAIDHARFAPADNYYPGLRMTVPMIYTAALGKNLQPCIEKVFGANPRHVNKAISQFSVVAKRPEELTFLQKIPHFDSASRKGLAAVHYLSHHHTSGTALYRHKLTGYEYVDSGRYERYMSCVKQEFAGREPQGYICGDTQEFEVIAAVEGCFNRLIMYRGSSLHSGMIQADEILDPHPARGRLTIASFFEFA